MEEKLLTADAPAAAQAARLRYVQPGMAGITRRRMRGGFYYSDAQGRRQYRYHARWAEVRNETKFYRLLAFGKLLPKLRRQVTKDLRRKALDLPRVCAIAMRVMEETLMRVGNAEYEKKYRSAPGPAPSKPFTSWRHVKQDSRPRNANVKLWKYWTRWPGNWGIPARCVRNTTSTRPSPTCTKAADWGNIKDKMWTKNYC